MFLLKSNFPGLALIFTFSPVTNQDLTGVIIILVFTHATLTVRLMCYSLKVSWICKGTHTVWVSNSTVSQHAHQQILHLMYSNLLRLTHITFIDTPRSCLLCFWVPCHDWSALCCTIKQSCHRSCASDGWYVHLWQHKAEGVVSKCCTIGWSFTWWVFKWPQVDKLSTDGQCKSRWIVVRRVLILVKWP